MSLLLLFNQPAIVPGSDWNPEINLPEEECRVITPDEFHAGALLSLSIDTRLIEYLDSHPTAIHDLTPRQFEELTAELLERSGFRTQVAPRGKDGGVDVFAERETPVGTELVIAQCKKYADDNKVGEPIIKQLYGDVTIRNATRGLLVTTSTFTSVALEFIRSVRYRLDGADITRLRDWIARARRTAS